jgi:hypothetical protein
MDDSWVRRARGLRGDLEALGDAIAEGLEAIAAVEGALWGYQDQRDEAQASWACADAEIRASLASVQKRMGPAGRLHGRSE